MNKKKTLTLFIHGIGSSNETWKQFIKVLDSDRTVRCEKYENTRTKLNSEILYYQYFEYESAFFKKGKFFSSLFEKKNGKKSSQSINQLSEDLASYIDSFKHFDKVNLVGHSMGGLIILDCLLSIYADKNEKLRKKIKNIVFIASPIAGSDDADDLKKYFGKKITAVELQQMGTDSENIASLKQGIDLYSLELKKDNILYIYGSSDARIEEDSRKIAKEFAKVESVQADHTTIKEPTSINDVKYIWVKDHLLEKIVDTTKNDELNSIIKLKEHWYTSKKENDNYQSHIVLESTYVETLYGSGTYITYAKYKIEMMEDGEMDFKHRFIPFDKDISDNIEENPYYGATPGKRFDDKSYKIKVIPKDIPLHAKDISLYSDENAKKWIEFSFDSQIISKGKIFYIIISISDKIDISVGDSEEAKKAKQRRKEYFHTIQKAPHGKRKIKYQLETYGDTVNKNVDLPFEPWLSIDGKKQVNNGNCKEGIYYKTWEWNFLYNKIAFKKLEFSLFESNDFLKSGAECKCEF